MKIIQYCGDTGNHSANVTVNQTYLIRKPAILNRAIKAASCLRPHNFVFGHMQVIPAEIQSSKVTYNREKLGLI